jgi:hypothetical protein
MIRFILILIFFPIWLPYKLVCLVLSSRGKSKIQPYGKIMASLPPLPKGARWDDAAWDCIEDPYFRVISQARDDYMRLHDEIDAHYRRAKDPSMASWQACKLACRRQIELGPLALQIHLAEQKANKEDDWTPHHTGYTRLAQLLYKEGGYAEAIKVAEAGIKAGWDPFELEKRIRLCRKKMTTQSKETKI